MEKVDNRTEKEKAIDAWLPITSSRNAKWWYSAFHNVTSMIGAGVLSLPYAMSELGCFSHRPLVHMESFMKEFEHLRIPLEEIKTATNNFGNKVIGSGGFGKVYEGELTHFKGRTMVAIKRLDRRFGQGDLEFLKEIMMLFCYTHQNIISLLGFCDEDGEKILVYEHAFNGSLDRHLSSTSLSWTKRIKICLDAARGISYLHDANGTQERVLHRDIKSSNILLDENWNGKVSDMGLSKKGPANQPHTFLLTNVVGTPGYCDPQYMTTFTLTKESDVYSFGVVLFEVLCGRLCFKHSNNQLEILVPIWKQKYNEKKLDEIMFQGLARPMDTDALETFADIAFVCLHDSREKRPVMSLVVERLESALEYQEPCNIKLPKEYEELVMAAVPPLKCRSVEEVKKRLLRGVHVNEGRTWLSLNKNGECCELISIAQCLIPNENETRYSSLHDSRFAVGCYVPSSDRNFKIRVKSQFLSPLITYTVNLVFKFNKKDVERYIGLKYALPEGKTYCSFLQDARKDGWFAAELFQFFSDERCVDLEIMFDKKLCPNLLIEGIEFQPLQKEPESHTAFRDEKVDMKSSDTYFKEKPETVYEDGKRYAMLPTRVALEEKKWKSLHKTRFEDVGQKSSRRFFIICEIESKILQPQTTYATYLIYTQEGEYRVQPPPVQVKDKISNSKTYHIYLYSPRTPVIIRGKVDENMFNPLSRPKIKGIPKHRADGRTEVQVWEFRTDTISEMIHVNLQLSSYNKELERVEVCGIEFRPI